MRFITLHSKLDVSRHQHHTVQQLQQQQEQCNTVAMVLAYYARPHVKFPASALACGRLVCARKRVTFRSLVDLSPFSISNVTKLCNSHWPIKKSKKRRRDGELHAPQAPSTTSDKNFLTLNLISHQEIKHDVASYHPITAPLFLERTAHVSAKLSMHVDGQSYSGTNDVRLESSILLIEHDVENGTFTLVSPLCFSNVRPDILLKEAKFSENFHITGVAGNGDESGSIPPPPRQPPQAFRSRRSKRMAEQSNTIREAQMANITDHEVITDKSNADLSRSNALTPTATGSNNAANSSSENQVRPFFDQNAKLVEDLYPVENIMPAHVANALYADAQLAYPTLNAESLPELFALKYRALQQQVDEDETESVAFRKSLALFQLARILQDLCYASVGRTFSSPLLQQHSSGIVRTHIEQNYTQTAGTVGGAVITDQLHKKVISHLIVVLLHMFDFQLPLSKVVEMMPARDRKTKQVQLLAKYLGCEVFGGAATDVIKLTVGKTKLPRVNSRGAFSGLTKRRK